MSTLTKFWTLAELTHEVEDELDMIESGFVTPEEMARYANRAIARAGQLVHTIYEDYFLTRELITLEPGVDLYSPPNRIYASKIRSLIYHNGPLIYEIKQIRDPKKFLRYRFDRHNGTYTDGDFRYFLINDTPGEWKIVFTPVPEVEGPFVECWYLRQPNRLSCDCPDEVLDIPEAGNFVISYMKYRCISKQRRGNPTPELEAAKLEVKEEEQELVATLTGMIADGDNEVVPDFSHYREHV